MISVFTYIQAMHVQHVQLSPSGGGIKGGGPQFKRKVFSIDHHPPSVSPSWREKTINVFIYIRGRDIQYAQLSPFLGGRK